MANEPSERKETSMYGTIGHYRVKPGMEAQFRQIFEEQERALRTQLEQL